MTGVAVAAVRVTGVAVSRMFTRVCATAVLGLAGSLATLLVPVLVRVLAFSPGLVRSAGSLRGTADRVVSCCSHDEAGGERFEGAAPSG